MSNKFNACFDDGSMNDTYWIEFDLSVVDSTLSFSTRSYEIDSWGEAKLTPNETKELFMAMYTHYKNSNQLDNILKNIR